MFTKKTPKGEASDKTPYTIYYPHSKPIGDRVWNQNYRQYISMDPARKNFGFRIERRYFAVGVATPVVDGAKTPVVAPVIETLAFDKFSIEEISLDESGNTCNNTFRNLNKILESHAEYYDDCHYVIIERQMVENYKATRIAQHTISYFMMKLFDRPLLPAIYEIAPQLKGRMLNVPHNLTSKDLKKWAIVKATEILTERNDEFALNMLKYYSRKADDLSDTVIQIEGIIRYWRQNNLEPDAFKTAGAVSGVRNPVIIKKTPVAPPVITQTIPSDTAPAVSGVRNPVKIIKIVKKPAPVASGDIGAGEPMESEESVPSVPPIPPVPPVPRKIKIVKKVAQ